MGLPPDLNPVRLHCANGVVVGHDGWLYLALGDHGCDVTRPEGDRLKLEGGGILRCRPDGHDRGGPRARGSGTRSTRTSFFPFHTSAFMRHLPAAVLLSSVLRPSRPAP